MPAKKNQKACDEEPAAPPKKSKKELDQDAVEKQHKLEEQRLLSATCGKTTATPAQKAMYEAYKAAPRFSEDKSGLLKKFILDKKCGWFQQVDQTKSETFKGVNAGLKGYGTRCRKC